MPTDRLHGLLDGTAKADEIRLWTGVNRSEGLIPPSRGPVLLAMRKMTTWNTKTNGNWSMVTSMLNLPPQMDQTWVEP